jgi:hypothetical protein
MSSIRKLQKDGVLLLNGVCPYYTMFPIDFPLERLRSAKKGDWVIDPFCGRGSTNYAARLLALPSVGIDSNPVAAAIAEAKLVAATPERIVHVCKEILETTQQPRVPKGSFWQMCYHPGTLRQLCTLRSGLRSSGRSPARSALRALILGRLHGPRPKYAPPSYLSNQMPRTYAAKPRYAVRFWRKHEMKPPEVDLLDLVRRKAAIYFGTLPPKVRGTVVCGDSTSTRLTSMVEHPANWVITSPPYYGMRTYLPDQWLRYWFLGGPSRVSYRSKAQLEHTSPEVFSQQLSEVWKNVAKACADGARLVVRFGGIRDRNQSPRDILWESFRLADSGWRITNVWSAGLATRGKRQAEQFQEDLRKPVAEFDVWARLDG